MPYEQSLPQELLNTDIHTIYNKSLSNIDQKQRALIATIATTGHIREQTQIIATGHINAGQGLTSILPSLKILLTDSPIGVEALEKLSQDLNRIGGMRTVQFAHILCIALAKEMDKLPKTGPEEEVKTAQTIIDSYAAFKLPNSKSHEPPQRPQSPEPTPMRVFAPKTHTPTPSAEVSSEDESDKENKNPNFKEEIFRLKQFMKTFPSLPIVVIFDQPPGHETFVKVEEQGKEKYWKDIVKALFVKEGKMTEYKGEDIAFLTMGTPHRPHFIGMDNQGNWVIAPTKKALFAYVS
jgi:hypothetical protein